MNRSHTLLKLVLILMVAGALSACGLFGGKDQNPSSQAPELPEDLESLVMLAKFDLTLRTGVELENIATVSVEQNNFTDSSLGVREPGVEYEAVVTPGLIIILEADGKEYEYHASGAKVILVPDPGF
jgi:hypothetical protein